MQLHGSGSHVRKGEQFGKSYGEVCWKSVKRVHVQVNCKYCGDTATLKQRRHCSSIPYYMREVDNKNKMYIKTKIIHNDLVVIIEIPDHCQQTTQ